MGRDEGGHLYVAKTTSRRREGRISDDMARWNPQHGWATELANSSAKEQSMGRARWDRGKRGGTRADWVSDNMLIIHDNT